MLSLNFPPRFRLFLVCLLLLMIILAVACNLPQVATPSAGGDGKTPKGIKGTVTLPCPLITLEPSATRVPVFTLEPTRATPPAELVEGAVVVAGGRSAAGGYAGDKIEIAVDFSANSPRGKVTQMRAGPVGGCGSDPAILESYPWEPFVPQRTYRVYLPINWVGFYVAAQYRDEQGNVSPVVCDDISVEGMARPPAVLPEGFTNSLRCLAETEVRPAPGEQIACGAVMFRWRPVAKLPEGFAYQVSVYQNIPGGELVGRGETREIELALAIDPIYAGELVWYVVLVDNGGTFVDHGKCSSFPASLMSVDPPEGIKGVRFWFKP